MEKWKDIKGYNGDYQISNFGNVRSFKGVCERLLIPQSNGNYYHVGLWNNNKVKTIMIHHLVWDHFGTSERNSIIIQVDHKDGNKLNNHIDNLQLLSSRDNGIKSIDKSKTTSKYMYVYKLRKKWQASFSGKYIGLFETELDAHNAVKKELEKLC